ncbi:MAG: hypothetical protein HGJ93_19315 [Desulfosarcina sp.]|nr:hypothetical protein [Desulfosarcina sp.]MBC2768016.1 hypothetical protein [Desulfosarcina sp.]
MDLTGPSTNRIPIDPEDLRPSPDAVARYFGGAGYNLTPKAQKRVHEGVGQAVTMVSPLAVYRVIPVEKIKTVTNSGWSDGKYSDIALDLIEYPVRYFAVYLATLGEALETACREMADQNKMYQAMLLDAVGTAMLDTMGAKIEKIVDSQARHMGLFTGCRLGPGLNGVALENQALLFNLLDGETVGVHLNESFIMRPSKSISAFVIFNDSQQREATGNKCSRCKMKRCQFRVRPPK